MKKILITLPLAILLAGCVSATPYQPLHKGYGYAEQQVEDTRFRVSFAGNNRTPRSKVETYLLYRAAELTLANGGTHFLISGTDTETETTFNQTIYGGFGHGHFSHFGHGVGFGTTTTSPRSKRYEAQALVLIVNGADEQGDLRPFDAESVMRHIGPTLERPGA